MTKTNIEWAQHVWNPIAGCSIVSPGCTNCYAMKMAYRIEMANAEAAAKYLPERSPHYNGTTKRVNGNAVWTGHVVRSEKALGIPLRRKVPTTWFVNSMSDLFHESVPDEWIDQVFAVMALTPQHTYQILTKRSARMRAYMNGIPSKIPFLGRMPLERTHLEAAGHMEGDGGYMDALKKAGNVYSLYLDAPWPLPNVWLGVSTERQKEADERIPDLLAAPAAVRFISAEPLLGPIDLKRWMPTGKWGKAPITGAPVYHQTYFMTKCGHCGWLGSSELAHEISYGDDADVACPQCNEIFNCDDFGDGRGLHWVIVGGENGPRPMHPDHARSLRDQCAAANVAFFLKQWGTNIPDEEREGRYRRVPKSVAGRLLDGREHNGFPGGQHAG